MRSKEVWGPALAGAAAFWVVNLAMSMTPMAADYRAALSISYIPMTDRPWHYLLIATVINALRIPTLGLVTGFVHSRPDNREPHTTG